MSVVIEIAGKPAFKERVRHRVVKTRDGRTFASSYTPARTRHAEIDIRAVALQVMGDMPPLAGALALTVDIFVPVPESWSGKQKNLALHGLKRPTVKPDIDNYEKLVLDALNGVVYRDDAQVCETRTSKFYALTPRMVIAVDRLYLGVVPCS